MEKLPTLEALTDYLRRLPSVGEKTAERMAFAFLNFDQDSLNDFSKVIATLKSNVHQCPNCGLYTEQKLCAICNDPERNSETVIVVSFAKDVSSFDRLDDYNGRYHVLNGVLSATSNVRPEDLSIAKLIERITSEQIKELIIATNPTIEGETTALYLAKRLAQYKIKITRIAYGMPMGGQIDYIDSLTLYKALENRRDLK